jgi:hypothetical protein
MAFRIQLRNDSLANWSEVNPILLQGEPAYENDTNRLKIGNGASGYVQLPYFYGNIESVNGLTGPVSIIGGTGIVISTGQSITISSNRPYKIYTVNLNASNQNDPTPIDLQSDFEASIEWSRGSTGVYVASLTGPTGEAGDFGPTYNRVMITPTSSATGAYLTGQYLTPESISITQVDQSGNALDGLNNAFVEIRVY